MVALVKPKLLVTCKKKKKKKRKKMAVYYKLRMGRTLMEKLTMIFLFFVNL